MTTPTYSPHPDAPKPPTPRGWWRVTLYILVLVCVILAVTYALRACAEVNT